MLNLSASIRTRGELVTTIRVSVNDGMWSEVIAPSEYAEELVGLLNAATDLLEGVCELAFILNSTPESGPVCWCCPNCADLRQPGEEHPVCVKLGAAVAKAKRV